MKTKAKPDAKAAATNDRAKRANPSGKAGKAEKPTGGKPDAAKGKTAAKVKVGILRFTIGGVNYEISESATDTELLRAVVIGLCKLSEQMESLRRTLWRIGEIRNYAGKGGKPDAGAESRKAQMVKLLGEIYYPQWEHLVNDIASGRIDTAPEYADLRAMPDWAAFRASFNADAAKPEAKAKAKGGKR